MNLRITNEEFNIKALVLCLGLLLFGFIRHYAVYCKSFEDMIVGDHTDGFFNIWIMENLNTFLRNWDFHDYVYTRIFAPHNEKVLFWSDNLIAPGLLYFTLRSVGFEIIDAFNAIALFMVVLGVACTWYFFDAIRRLATSISGASLSTRLGCLCIAILTYFVSFSDSRVMLTVHFQNLVAPLVLLGIVFALQFMMTLRKSYLASVCLVWLVLLYSTPYYWVLFSALLLFLSAICIGAHGINAVAAGWRKTALIASSTFLIGLPVITGYAAMTVPFTEQSGFSARLHHIVLPERHTYLGTILSELGFAIPDRTHESLAYAGVFVMPAILFLICWRAFCGVVDDSRRIHWKKVTVLMAAMVLAVLYILGCTERSDITAITIVAVLLIALAYVSTIEIQVPLALSVCAIICAGSALGPAPDYPTSPANPSAWGLLAAVVPGFDSIRSVGRFGTLISSLLVGIAWYICLTLPSCGWLRRQHALAILLIPICISIIIDLPRPPYINNYNISLSPTYEERKFFTMKPRRILILPANNLSLIPGFMVYFEQLPSTQLVNGYSGRFSDTVLNLQLPDIAITEHLISETLHNVGATHVLFDKRFFPQPERTNQLGAHFLEEEFATKHFTIMKIRNPVDVR